MHYSLFYHHVSMGSGGFTFQVCETIVRRLPLQFCLSVLLVSQNSKVPTRFGSAFVMKGSIP